MHCLQKKCVFYPQSVQVYVGFLLLSERKSDYLCKQHRLIGVRNEEQCVFYEVETDTLTVTTI
jgi:hypothetical protein